MLIALASPIVRARKIRRAILASRRRWLTLSKDKIKNITAIYAAAAVEIQNQLSFYADDDGSVTYRRLQSLLSDVNLTLRALKQGLAADLRAGLDRSVAMGVEAYEKPLEISGVGAAVLFANFTTVHTETLEALWSRILEDGLQLSDRLWRIDRNAIVRVTEIIESAVVQGMSAREAANALLRGGEPLPGELVAKMGLNSSQKIGSDVLHLFTEKGRGNVAYNSLRLARTELSRAYREGFLRTGEKLDFVVGHRWNLSPTHPRPDICDDYASADPDGLAPGGYREGNYPPTPAHPQCLCFDTPIFKMEVEN